MKILIPKVMKKIKKIKCCLALIMSNFIDWVYDHLLWTVFAVFCWSITPFMFILADIERGYDAIGGEIFIPLLPVIVWVIGKGINDE